MSFRKTSWHEIAPTPEARLVAGGPGAGKTQRLVSRAVELERAGAGPDDVAVFAATPNAARILALRLGEAGALRLAACVTTPLAFALDVLGSLAAWEFTGRAPRLLVPYERAFLMEDLKTSGLRPGRLAGLLGYLERGLADLCDADSSWLQTGEERGMLELLMRYLGLYGAVDDVEAGGLALRYLAARPQGRGASFGHVIVDDYQLLSRASQTLVNRVARDSIWIAADEAGSFQAFERFPNADGVQEFVDANGWAKIDELEGTWRNPDVARAVGSMRRESGIDALSAGTGEQSRHCFGQADALHVAPTVADGLRTSSAAVVERFAGPGEECRAAASRVAQLLAEGYQPADIVIVAPHRRLRHALRRELAALGVSAGCLSDSEALGGDVRSVRECARAIAACALSLAADEGDGASWRAWCGFGDPLAASNAFAHLVAQEPAAREELRGAATVGVRGLLDAAQARVRAGEKLPESVMRVLERYHEGLELAQAVRGADLATFARIARRHLACFGDEARAQVDWLGEAALGCEHAGRSVQDAVRALREHALFPELGSQDLVCVCDVRESAGLDPRALVLVGFANGMFPSCDYFDRERMSLAQAERMRVRDAAAFSCLVGRAREAVYASSFLEVPHAVAQLLRVRVERIRLRDGVRMARTSPSVYLAYLQ